MDTIVQTASSAGGEEGTLRYIADWVFLEGDRHLVAGSFLVLLIGVVGLLISAGVLAVGPGSSVAGLFGSGITAGVVTLLTIALSINQLILSRVFGSVNELVDRLDGARTMRGRVEELSGRSSSPNDPAEFLSLLAMTLVDRVITARSLIDEANTDSPEITRPLGEIAEYGRNIDTQIEPGTPVNDVLGLIVGPEYAINMTAVEHLRKEYQEVLPANARTELQAAEELLEFVAIVRQFFKTIAIQQDFAILSRMLVYSGLLALLASVSLTLVYRTGSTTLSPTVLRVAVPLVLGIAAAPLALFAAYILRAATIANRTVSVGPFVPPTER